MKALPQLFLAISFVNLFSCLPTSLNVAFAQTISPGHASISAVTTSIYSPHPDLGMEPGWRIGRTNNTRGGGAECNSDEKMIALVPDSNIGLTVEEYPSFWF